MGHVRDRWMIVGDRGRKVKGPRWGQGRRWQARWTEDGHERSAAFGTRDEATIHLARVETGAPLITGDGITLDTFAPRMSDNIRYWSFSVTSLSSTASADLRCSRVECR